MIRIAPTPIGHGNLTMSGEKSKQSQRKIKTA
jgi:hypothetical protein